MVWGGRRGGEIKFMRKAVRFLDVPSVSTQSRDQVSLIPPEEWRTVLHSMAELDSETQQAVEGLDAIRKQRLNKILHAEW